jgi:hypothetical protein
MQDQQTTSPKNLNKKNVKTNIEYIKNDKLYVEYKTFRQETAEMISKFSKHFSNEENVTAIKTNICALIDDLSSHAKTINKAKSSGIGHGIVNVLFPRTVRAINEKNNRKKSNKSKLTS